MIETGSHDTQHNRAPQLCPTHRLVHVDARQRKDSRPKRRNGEPIERDGYKRTLSEITKSDLLAHSGNDTQRIGITADAADSVSGISADFLYYNNYTAR